MFGGCPKWEMGKSVGVQQKLAKTILLDFSEYRITLCVHTVDSDTTTVGNAAV